MEGDFGLGLLLIAFVIIGSVGIPWLWNSMKGTDLSRVGPVDYSDPKVRIMKSVIPAIINSIDSDLPRTKIAYESDDPDDVITLTMDIEQFRYLRKKRTLWDHQGYFAERDIQRRWARQPAAVREWEGIQYVVPIAISAAFRASSSLRTVRFWIGDTENYSVTVCRVSVEAQRGQTQYDWRYDQKAKGYLAPITRHSNEPATARRTTDFADDPYDFEQQVAQMLRDRGLAVEVTGGPGDEGIDIVAHDNTPLTGGTYLVQCKRYGPDHKVGVAEVRELYGTVQEKRASKGILVTSSVFTHQALRFAEDKPLELVDGRQLASMLATTAPVVSIAPEDEGVYGEKKALPDVYLKAELDFRETEQAESMASALLDAAQAGSLTGTPLVAAVVAGRADVASVLLARGADPNARTGGGMSPLLAATFGGFTEVMSVLLSHGADPNTRYEEGITLLAVAAHKGQTDLVSLLLDHGADPLARIDAGSTPLHVAATEGCADVVEVLLKHGADSNALDEEGSTPLHLAAAEGRADVADLLLDHGADTTIQDDKIWTPLMWAAGKGHIDVISVLLDHGTDIDAENKEGSTALASAVVLSPGLATVAVLLNRGADPNAGSPLKSAILLGLTDVIPLLLDHGADLGPRPLVDAALAGHPDVIVLLLDRGADMGDGEPLLMAAMLGHVDAVSVLLDNGADINVRSSVGTTPLAMAAGSGHVDVVALLLRRGADVNARNDDGETPLALATEQGHADIASLLLKQGAES